MKKFKIILKGKCDEKNDYKLEWKEKLKGDCEVITTALSAELILYTMFYGMSKKDFMKQIKEHYEIIEKEKIEKKKEGEE